MKLEDLANKEFEITSEGLLKVAEKKTGKFVPKEGKSYWYVNLYGTVAIAIYDSDADRWLIKHHPVFRTEDEAVEYKRYLDVLDKYKHEFTDEEWKDCNLVKWIIKYFCNDQTLHVFSRFVGKYSNCVYFKSEEDAKNFIKEAGEDNIKKFMFDMWE